MQLKDASRTPTVLGLDARAFAFMFPSLFFVRASTILLDLAVIGFFVLLRVKRIGPQVAYLKVRSRLRGRITAARPWWFSKKWRVR